MPDPIVVPAIVLAALPIGGVADAVIGHFFTSEKTERAPDALNVDFSPVMELMAAATCAPDDDDLPATA
ncbi:MAG: hypothetical protein HYX65_01155 [Gemmatimonadetes bacterium]|nr:hypothetical protein [Gemmatimonadota bacterium]